MNRSKDVGLGCLLGVLFPVLILVALYSRCGASIRALLEQLWKDDRVVALHELPPPGARVSSVQRLDTNGDLFKEWVVTYQYDIAGWNFPVSCVIYDLEGKGARIIYPYPLLTPGGDYLGEGAVGFGMEDILQEPAGAAGRAELLVSDSRTLSVFRVKNTEPQLDPTCQVFPNPYQCEGFFRGNLSVSRSGDRVVVTERVGSERSQFASRRVYRPSDGSYFRPGTQTLLPAVEASIEFAYGKPAEILDTPYPEKLVLGFYQDLLTDAASGYLTEDAKKRFAVGQLDYGSPWPRSSVQRVLVQEISYVPGSEDVASAVSPVGQQPTAAQVVLKARFYGPSNQSELREIRCYLVRVGTQWKLQDAGSSGL